MIWELKGAVGGGGGGGAVFDDSWEVQDFMICPDIVSDTIGNGHDPLIMFTCFNCI